MYLKLHRDHEREEAIHSELHSYVDEIRKDLEERRPVSHDTLEPPYQPTLAPLAITYDRTCPKTRPFHSTCRSTTNQSTPSER